MKPVATHMINNANIKCEEPVAALHQMELHVLMALDYRLRVVTTVHLLDHVMTVIAVTDNHHPAEGGEVLTVLEQRRMTERARKFVYALADITLVTPELLMEDPLDMTCAILSLTRTYLQCTSSWTTALHRVTGRTAEQFVSTHAKLTDVYEVMFPGELASPPAVDSPVCVADGLFFASSSSS
jgi:hypothetical protein